MTSDRWIIVIDPDGFYIREVLGSSLGPAFDEAEYRVRVIPGTYATIELAQEAIGRERGFENR